MPRQLVIRTLVESDLPSIQQIDEATFPPGEQYDDATYRQMSESGLSFVALDGETIVGYAFVQLDLCTRVRSLAVHSAYRRQGFGRALLRTVIGRCESDADILVDESNTPAIRCYESLGFQRAEADPLVPDKLRMLLPLEDEKSLKLRRIPRKPPGSVAGTSG